MTWCSEKCFILTDWEETASKITVCGHGTFFKISREGEGKGSPKVVVGLNRAICEGWRIFARGEKAPPSHKSANLGEAYEVKAFFWRKYQQQK